MTNRDKLLKKNNLTNLEIDKKVSEAHPYNEEIAILRKAVYALATGNSVPTEFLQYYTDAEQKKAEVKARLQ